MRAAPVALLVVATIVAGPAVGMTAMVPASGGESVNSNAATPDTARTAATTVNVRNVADASNAANAPTASNAANAPNAATAQDASNATLGAAISSFMLASAADANSDVENAMFAVEFNNTNASNRAQLIRHRVELLQDRIEALREEHAELLAQASGELNVSTRAQAARLTARINGLQHAIDQTALLADRAGLNLTALDRLRQEAAELTGPAVAAIATGLVDDEDRGPPGDRGGDGRGPPEDGGQGNQEGGDLPIDFGNETGNGTDNPNGSDAPPNGAGNGNDGQSDAENGNGGGLGQPSAEAEESESTDS